MLPKIALVGRPNVGKSALFNRICQKRLSIVDEQEGITRDRLYAKAEIFGRPFILIDTGGIDFSGTIPFAELVKKQAIFVPHRSFSVYVGYEKIEKEFAVPIFGNRFLLKAEERNTAKNQHWLTFHPSERARAEEILRKVVR